MENLKRVSFNVTKAIKEAGYPQEKLTDKVYLVNCDKEGKLAHYNSALFYDCVVAPTYLDTWLWLWREKNIKIDIDYCINKCAIFDITQEVIYARTFNDPEEAIIAAIEYLVDNKLLK